MSMDFSKTLVVGITSSALFDLSAADKFFREWWNKGNPDLAIKEYRKYMLDQENKSLKDGTGMPLIRSLLQLNDHQKEGEPPFVEVVVMSRNSPETGVRVLNAIRNGGLKISRYVFTGGESVVPYLDAFDVDLFLTTNEKDAQKVRDSRSACATAILKEPPSEPVETKEGQVRLAFDGDAVLFDESSEIDFKKNGIRSFHQNENANQNTPMQDGPHAVFLRKLSALQQRLPCESKSPLIYIAIVTARNAPAEMRVIKTLRHWNLYINGVFFLGGVEKAKVLKAFQPHIFFDDQDKHLEDASKNVAAALVPYESGSPLQK